MRDPQQALEQLRNLATTHPTKRFSKLLKIVRQEVFLARAWERVRTNVGSRTPGVDGITKRTADPQFIHRLAQDLKTRQYVPQPLRRVYIPKGGKGAVPSAFPPCATG
jgi:retron-type reverse transcriptase